ncbi:MAG TPA: DHH family phosphoesterase [Candidatus Dormibacteraeota bacterium]|nr:DHH family phosphoesterase [Candidatus Dormibacteraeota bacterium]
MADALAQIHQAVLGHEAFLLVAHKDADADSLGSVLAFADYLGREGKSVYPWVPDPLPRGLAYLPGYEAVNQREAPADAIAITFDAGSPSRFGNLRERIARAPLTIVIDHHASNEGFGDLSLVQPEVAATGVIVFQALRSWGAHVSPEAATNLYAAIFTDTGGFRHDNTTGPVLQLGADLATLGADPAWVALKSYKSRPETTLKLQALASAATNYELDGRLVWSQVTVEMLQQSGADLEESEGIIDILQSLDTMLCAVLFKEASGELTRVSVRSRGPIEAHELVGPFGGGGHRRAAGAEVHGTIAEVKTAVLSEARRLIIGAVPL